MNKLFRFGARKLHQFKAFAKRRPILSVGLILILFLGLMLLGNFIRKPKNSPSPEPQPLTVKVFNIGEAARLSVMAKAKKAGVIEIVAQTSGVIGKINVIEGDEVKSGQSLLAINTTYGSGNIFSLQRQISGAQKANVDASYPDQIRLIELGRQQANDTAANADELKKISEKALSDTRSLISLNETIINSLNTSLNQYTATNSAGTNDAAILSTRQLISQYQSGLASLQNSARTSEYQIDKDKIPANLPNLQKEIALTNLNLQEKAYALGKEISGLQYRIAQLNERLAFPSSPVSGQVERVHVLPNQIVNPGQVLVTISNNEAAPVMIEAFVPHTTAQAVSSIEPSRLTVGNQTYELFPQFVSAEAVEGTLRLIKFVAPAEAVSQIDQGQNLNLNVPLSAAGTSSVVPFIPLDSVYQSQTQAFVYVVEAGKAAIKTIELGPVTGSFVEVKSGLSSSDQVITSRNVISGQPVASL